MEKYVVRQPILDRKKEVFAYEILWKNDSDQANDKDITAANAIDDFFYELNNQKFLDGKITFITFTPNLLLKNIPKMFASNRLVIQIDDSVLVHPLARKIIYRFKKQGYQIAIRDFEFAPRYFSILDIVDYIKIDFTGMNESSLRNIAGMGSNMHKSIIAYNVNTPETLDLAVELNCDYMEGANVAQQFSSKVHRMDHMQSNFFQLMVAITKDEPNIDEITEIVSRDVTLAFPLIKLVNSAYFALRNRVQSVKQALIILGLGQLKEWVYLLSFKDGSNDYPEELLRMSFLRAHFCSELTPYVADLEISKSEAYLMGMFSTLGSLLEVPLEDAISELFLSDAVKNALLRQEGRCGTLYRLVQCYENADWKGMTFCAQELQIPESILTQKYFECVEYVNNIWRQLTNPYDKQAGDSEGLEGETEITMEDFHQ